MVLIFAIFPMMLYFLIYYIAGSYRVRVVVGSFHLIFHAVTAPLPQAKEPVWGFCQLPSMIISIIHLVIGKITTGWVCKLSELTVNWLWAVMVFHMLGYQCRLTPGVQEFSKYVGIVLPPIYSFLSKWSVWSHLGRIISICISYDIAESFLLGTSINNLWDQKMGSDLKTGQEIITLL